MAEFIRRNRHKFMLNQSSDPEAQTLKADISPLEVGFEQIFIFGEKFEQFDICHRKLFGKLRFSGIFKKLDAGDPGIAFVKIKIFFLNSLKYFIDHF